MDLVSQLDGDLTIALKAKDGLTADTLRGLKNRLQNERIAKGRDLEKEEVLQLVRSELKRRKEAAAAFETGHRPELAQKELQEAEILSKYVPAGPKPEEIAAFIDQLISQENVTTADFGKAMGKLKAAFPAADGGELASQLKDTLSK